MLSLADYRRRHALYKGDPSLRAAHVAHPWFLTWDDHEVVNDYSGSEGAAPFVQQRAAAYQAWYEHLPSRPASALEPQIHRRRRWVHLLDLTVLDLRPYRSAQNLSAGTILGSAQKQWLLDGISSSSSSWTGTRRSSTTSGLTSTTCRPRSSGPVRARPSVTLPGATRRSGTR